MILLRRMEIADLDEILRIEGRAFALPWSREAFVQELEGNDLATYFIVETEGRIAGYIGLWKIVDEGHITNIAIDPELQRRGLGAALLTYALEEMNKEGVLTFTLEVRASNAPAIQLYEKFGFEVRGRRKGYYPDNKEDALLMWRDEK